jgi:chromosomal replication initiation ATPase DnaA
MDSECDGYRQEAARVPSDRQRIADLDRLIGRTFSVKPESIRSRCRGQGRTAFARQVAIYLSHIGFGLTLTEVAALFGRDRTTVAHACRVIERKRDEPQIDATVGMLEQALGVATRAIGRALEGALRNGCRR